MCLQGNDIGVDRRMTFEEVRDEVCRLVSTQPRSLPNAFQAGKHRNATDDPSLLIHYGCMVA